MTKASDEPLPLWRSTESKSTIGLIGRALVRGNGANAATQKWGGSRKGTGWASADAGRAASFRKPAWLAVAGATIRSEKQPATS